MNRYLVPLRRAFDAGRLDEFLAEQHAGEADPKDRAELDRALMKVLKESKARQRAATLATRLAGLKQPS